MLHGLRGTRLRDSRVTDEHVEVRGLGEQARLRQLADERVRQHVR
jgi:hypothetical protein